MKTEKEKLKTKCVKTAMSRYLVEHPHCEICGWPAITSHHLIHQARSNYLKTKFENLVAVCGKCHFKIHSAGYETLIIGQIVNARGKKWFNRLQKAAQIKIKDDKDYWEKEFDKLRR